MLLSVITIPPSPLQKYLTGCMVRNKIHSR
nr:MAG TPA: hypothetical protein [Caudoviricetes sp.]